MAYVPALGAEGYGIAWMRYEGKRAIVTGGLGFIGSNLVIELVREGAQVTVIDSLIPGCGGNPHNIAPVRDRIRIVDADVGDVTPDVIAGSDVIFNLAGEISHIHSMQFPERDLQLNTISQLRFLLACCEAAPGVRDRLCGYAAGLRRAKVSACR